MKLMRLGDTGAEKPFVERADGAVFELHPLTNDIDGAFLESDWVSAIDGALAAGLLPAAENWESLRVGSPIARPTAVICIGMNYAAHAAESSSAPPALPIVFFKHPNTVVGPFDDVLVPPRATRVDWEVELAIVIGKRARYLTSEADSLSHIAGFCIANDVSERDYQIEQSGGQWSKGKSCETFNPLGPVLVPASEVDYGNLRLRSAVNGEPRQDSSTADMIFSVDHLVWYLSQFMVLEPGDVINTGTPQGVALSGRFPYLADGDLMELDIEGLGSQRQRVRDATLEPVRP